MKKWIKAAIKSKTMIFSFLITALGIIQTSTDVLKGFLSEKTVGVVVMLIGIVIAALRVVTTTPLKDKNG